MKTIAGVALTGQFTQIFALLKHRPYALLCVGLFSVASPIAALASTASSPCPNFGTGTCVENDIETHPNPNSTVDHNTYYETPGVHADSFHGVTVSGSVATATPRVEANSSARISEGYSSVGGVSYADLFYSVMFSGPAAQIGVRVLGQASAYASNGYSDVGAFVQFSSDRYASTSPNYMAGDQTNFFGVEQDIGTGRTSYTSFDNEFQFTANTWYKVWIDAAAFSSADANGITSSNAFAYADPYFILDDTLAKQYAIVLSDGVGNGPISLSAVPLPASAPMFGAALLGLAGLGYAARRKKAAAAA